MIYRGSQKIKDVNNKYRSYYCGGGFYNTSRNIGASGDYFYFVSSDQKIVRLDISKVNSNDFEKVLDGAGSAGYQGKVEDFVVKKEGGMIGVLTNEGKVFEIDVHGTVKDRQGNNSDRPFKNLKEDSQGELKTHVGNVSYWNNIIEVKVQDKSTYIVNGYMKNMEMNLCMSLQDIEVMHIVMDASNGSPHHRQVRHIIVDGMSIILCSRLRQYIDVLILKDDGKLEKVASSPKDVTNGNNSIRSMVKVDDLLLISTTAEHGHIVKLALKQKA